MFVTCWGLERAGHKEECACNYMGSSNGMEIADVKPIWLCSVKDFKLCCTTFIGDRDAKTFACLTELKPYGEDVEIIKMGVLVMYKKEWEWYFGS